MLKNEKITTFAARKTTCLAGADLSAAVRGVTFNKTGSLIKKF
jgi:hypothetical protein